MLPPTKPLGDSSSSSFLILLLLGFRPYGWDLGHPYVHVGHVAIPMPFVTSTLA